MEVGETVVLVGDVDGMPAGKEGLVIKVRDDMLLIGFRSPERLECIRLTNYTADHGAGLLGLLSVRPCGGREFSDLVNWKVAQSWQD